MDPEGWTRRRDLEGGKQVGIWLAEDSDLELYVEDMGYRGGDYVVWRHDAGSEEWEELGRFDDQAAAFGRAREWAGEHG